MRARPMRTITDKDKQVEDKSYGVIVMKEWVHQTLMTQSTLYRSFWWAGNEGMMELMRSEFVSILSSAHG